MRLRPFALSGVLLLVLPTMTGSIHAMPQQDSTAGAVTFNKQVLPILQKNCQACHRPGEIAPMSFLTYDSVRPWAKAMKTAVATRKMPPWFADPKYGHFGNDRSLKQADIDTIAKWADAGAPEGNAKEAPQAIQWPADGWDIQPDVVIDGPEFKVAAHPKNDVIEWMFITVPSTIQGRRRPKRVTILSLNAPKIGATNIETNAPNASTMPSVCPLTALPPIISA